MTPKFLIVRLQLACLMSLSVLLAGCSTTWVNRGDSCVYESEGPPLRRVVNYTDNALCERPREPRTPPNPRIRESPSMD